MNESCSPGERWVADGTYSGSFDERFARADTVISRSWSSPAAETSISFS